MKEESDLYRMYSYFPNVIDILINHGPAYSLLNKVISGENAGSRALLEYIDRVKPKLVICGHLHESYGEVKYGQSHIVNCPVLNESYELVN
jgi:Icc-related predicted phosphoesterase